MSKYPNNYIFLADHNECFSNIASLLSYEHFYEEEVASPQHLNVDIANKFPFFTYDELREHIFSNISQGYYLQANNEVEDIYTNHTT